MRTLMNREDGEMGRTDEEADRNLRGYTAHADGSSAVPAYTHIILTDDVNE